MSLKLLKILVISSHLAIVSPVSAGTIEWNNLDNVGALVVALGAVGVTFGAVNAKGNAIEASGGFTIIVAGAAVAVAGTGIIALNKLSQTFSADSEEGKQTRSNIERLLMSSKNMVKTGKLDQSEYVTTLFSKVSCDESKCENEEQKVRLFSEAVLRAFSEAKESSLTLVNIDEYDVSSSQGKINQILEQTIGVNDQNSNLLNGLYTLALAFYLN